MTDALLRRLNSASLSDGDDEDNDKYEMTARKDIISRRKTGSLIEKKKLDSEAKDSVTAPAEPLPANRRLSNHHNFFAVHIFLMDLEISKAHTSFTVFLKSGQGLQLNADIKCYFRSFHHFRETLLRVFFTKLREPIAVIEQNLKRIKLALSGVDGLRLPLT